MTEITLFRFDNKPLHVDVQANGELMFSAPDVCRALGLSDVTSSLRVLDEDEKGPLTVQTLGGTQEVNGITEPGLYKLISRSRKPEAKRFDRWVRHDVLPAISKTGAYSVQAPIVLTEREIVAQALQITTRQVAELTAEVSTLRPQAEAFQIIGDAEGELGVRDVGREVKLGQAWVTETLLARKWACKQGGKLRPAHYGLEHDYVCLRASSYKCGITGETKVRDDFKVTRKGINRLAQIIANIRAATQASASREMEMH